MQQSTVTLIVAGLGIAGTFGSGAMAQWMARSFQREQWLRDRRKEEFRELITTLARSYLSIRTSGTHEVEPRREAETVIRDRIFIVVEMQNLDVFGRWARIEKLLTSNRHEEAERLFHDLNTDIVVSALNKPDAPSEPRLSR